jgi:uncharacterized membrane protein YkgB
MRADVLEDSVPAKTYLLQFASGSYRGVLERALSSGEGRAASAVRVAVGIIYLYFGALKFFPAHSPAESLATKTVTMMSGGILSPAQALFLLALFECVIGLGFIFNFARPLILCLFLLHMLGTFSPFLLLPELIFKSTLLVPTIEGQYIIKNILFLVVGWTLLLPDVLATHRSPKTTLK